MTFNEFWQTMRTAEFWSLFLYVSLAWALAQGAMFAADDWRNRRRADGAPPLFSSLARAFASWRTHRLRSLLRTWASWRLA